MIKIIRFLFTLVFFTTCLNAKESKNIYEKKFNAKVSEPKSYKEHGVTVVFIELENTN